VAPVVFPKRMGRPDEFANLVRSLIENDYMNAEGSALRRRDQVPAQVMTGNVRLLSDLRERALSGLPRQAGPSTGPSGAEPRAVANIASNLPQRRLVIVGHEVPVDVERERSAVGDQAIPGRA